MEVLTIVLPNDILNKIRLYHSHPTADLLRNEELFRKRRYEIESVHGCPYDRGCSDAYYWREPNPHYWENCRSDKFRIVYDLTDDEIEAYELGYKYEEDRK